MRWIFLASRVMCVPVRHKSSSPLVVFELFSNNPPPAGLHLALRGSCVDSPTHPSLLRDRPTPFPPAPHPHLRQGCPAPRPCAEEALAGSSMGAVLPASPLPPPPPICHHHAAPPRRAPPPAPLMGEDTDATPTLNHRGFLPDHNYVTEGKEMTEDAASIYM